MEAKEIVQRTMTVEEAGRQLGISRNTAYEAARQGQIPIIKIGKRLLVPVEQFDRLLRGDAPEAA